VSEISASFVMTLPPTQAVAYFESKGMAPTLGWQDMEDEAHAVKFTVAGITKLDVLSDIHQGLKNALANGGTLRQFQDEVEPLLQRKGWLGRGLVADEHGELQGKRLMPYRLETIFRTNIQSAYAAGRYQQQMRTVAERPYWEYDAVMDNRTRPMHAALNGRVFRADDPIWQTIYPPNGYRCRCWVRALTQAQIKNHPVGVESSAGRLVTVQQPYGTQGETRPVTAYRDPKTGQLLVPDAGFHLNPGKSYLAGLGQSLLEKGVSAAPQLAAVAVRETLGNNPLVSAMNRDLHQWIQGVGADSAGDFRRVGALSPRVLSQLNTGAALPSPVISLTAEALQGNRDAGASLWPRLVSVLFRPLAVLLRGERLFLVTGETGQRRMVTLTRATQGFEINAVKAWTSQDTTGAELLDGELPEE
jgi:SPP1 gp7 family putative phage head morphogenesis protein